MQFLSTWQARGICGRILLQLMRVSQNGVGVMDKKTAIRTTGPDAWIGQWLHEVVFGHSQSKRTLEAYAATMGAFRATLAEKRLDVDSPAISRVTAVAQAYVSHTERGRALAPATIAQRTAILSSFYRFAVKHGMLLHDPIAIIHRPTVQAYAAAKPIATPALDAIDRSTITGQRDYCILALLLTTGRRASEIARLCGRDLDDATAPTVVTTLTKGKKIMNDVLVSGVARALREYLGIIYPAGAMPDNPIFISFSTRNQGQQITIQTVANICAKHLGTSKIHATRHTFAVKMEEAGASLSAIQNRLGHSNAATTSRYLEALKSGQNPYAEQIAATMGIE